MKTYIKVMKALSDPNRARVIKLLHHRELCVCEVQELLELSQSTVSRHLKQLEDAGLVSSRKQGSWLHYRLSDGSTPYAGQMLQLMRGWLDNDTELQQMQVRLAATDRNKSCQGNE